jgi:osmoprotectant transport system substrate-binding protein
MRGLGIGLRPTVTRRRPAGSPVGLVLVAALVLAAAGCDRGQAPPPSPPEDPGRPTIQLASFDFPESQLLAQLYGQALGQHGFPVEQVVGLGSREVVAPALEQGKVDMVPEYLGSALNFLNDRDRVATADPRQTHARRHHLERISDLAPLARRLVIGGPPECPQRPLCLGGLQEVYRLSFARFEAMPSRAVTAAALQMGEIDVGMIDTTDPSLLRRGADLVQLADDRRLQPADNVVPVLRRELVDAYGPPLVSLVNAVSAQLTTVELTRLNLEVADGRPPADAAAGWLRAHPVIG